MDLGLQDKTVLVTGSNRGTGEGVVGVLAREGATILVHGPQDGDSDAVVDAITGAGGKAFAIAGDLTTDAGADKAAGEALAATGRVDVLVNNLGSAERGGWWDATSGDWIAMYEKNVLSAARMIRLLVPQMRERGAGRVIQIGTVGTTRPSAQMPHYYASKAALPGMTVSLAQELAGTGITVNTISPGLIKTREVEEMFRRQGERKGWGADWADIEKGIMTDFMSNPTGRVGLVEEVGNLVAFIASDKAGYINGANLRIDGGALDVVN